MNTLYIGAFYVDLYMYIYIIIYIHEYALHMRFDYLNMRSLVWKAQPELLWMLSSQESGPETDAMTGRPAQQDSECHRALPLLGRSECDVSWQIIGSLRVLLVHDV